MLDPALTLPLALLIHHTSPVLHIAFLNTPSESKSSRVWGGGKIAPLIPRLLNIHPLASAVVPAVEQETQQPHSLYRDLFRDLLYPQCALDSNIQEEIHTDLILNSKYPIIIIQILADRPPRCDAPFKVMKNRMDLLLLTYYCCLNFDTAMRDSHIAGDFMVNTKVLEI